MQAEYERLLRARQEEAAAHERMSARLSGMRLATVLAGALLVWWRFALLPAPVLVFFALIVWHERVARRQARAELAIAHYLRALARLRHEWGGVGDAGDRFRDPAHAYADDLDLFGTGSLYQMINSARTAAGEQSLAAWLKGPGEVADVRSRQEAIRELQGRTELREDLALAGEGVRSEAHAGTLVEWGQRPPVRSVAWQAPLAAAVTAAMLVSLALMLFSVWPLRVFLVALLINLAFRMATRREIPQILSGLSARARDLEVLGHVLERFEKEPLKSPRLAELKARLSSEGSPPSRQIARLGRLVAMLDQERNPMFAIVAAPLLWSSHCAYGIERWRQRSGRHAADWIEAVGELEALNSLAAYAAEHPGDPFPDLAAGEPVFDGEGIAHPLLPEDSVVRNDVRLGGELRLLVVSGSNMSGKSTLLRAVGLNTVLAWAGAPVRAKRLRLSPLMVGSSIRVQDSVLDGKSRFYAEITRLRQLMDMARGQPPLLFLLDELLSGTNSHDRRIGSEAVLRALVARPVMGLVTTHDLALAHIADASDSHAANVHFEDHIESGRIAFDYRMRPGVVRKSNAIELMRAVGLPV